MQHIPTLVSESGNYGTVNIKTVNCSRHFKIKVYPRLDCVIKSFNNRLQASVPKTLQGIRNQAAGAQRVIHNCASKEDQAVVDIRIEVTIKANSLQDAHRLGEETGFLDPSYWLRVGDGNVAKRGLTAQLVIKEGLLANANSVHSQAAQSNVFVGAAADKPTKNRSSYREFTESSCLECWYPTTYQVTRSHC